MPTTRSDLKPYKSFLLVKIRKDADPTHIVEDVLDDVSNFLKITKEGPRRLIARSDVQTENGLETAFVHFAEELPVPWSINESLIDTVNQLVLICRHDQYVAFCVSDNRFRAPIFRKLGGPGMPGLSNLEPIASGYINAGFVRGTTRTLWLSGTHRRSSVKADSKILSGLNLRDALNPLEDQSYYFTAARSNAEIEGLRSSVGASPRGSRIWVGASNDWPDFRKVTTQVLQRLKNTKRPKAAPLPVVAITAVNPKEVADAFDVGLVPPEQVSDDPSLDPGTLQDLEQWSYEGGFRIVKTSGPDFDVEITLAGRAIGTASFTMDIRSVEDVEWAITGDPAAAAFRADHEKALQLCKNRAWLKVWYDSGHTLSDGAIFEMRHRDMPFWGFRWAELHDFDVTKEKPDPLDAIGQQDSLFCWTYKYWPNLGRPLRESGGWLACDDGSMEIADFINLDDASDPPTLSLIHVKGAGSDLKERGISVSKYEVVTGQAVKNLRSLDRLLLDEGLRDGIGKKVGQLVWHDRRQTTRQQMLTALGRLGAEYQRRIVILQPHLTRAAYHDARAHPRSRGAARMRQLDTLLLSAQASAHGASADLVVIGQR